MNDEKPGDTERIDGRVDTLETRLTYLDETIETLNSTIIAQRKQIDALTRLVASLGERLQEGEVSLPATPDEPPPHY
jgi:SlyX protein